MVETASVGGVFKEKTVELGPRCTKHAVLIPVLNEGQTILGQLKRMRDGNCPADVILSDGGSQDGSTELKRLAQLGVRSLLVTSQPGLGAALRHGIRYALEQGYEGVITIDGNGKDGVEAIPRFVELLDEGYDLYRARGLLQAEHARTRRWIVISASAGLSLR